MNTTHQDTAPGIDTDASTPDNRLQPALSLLDAIIADRDVLEAWPAEDRERLLQAVALVHHPEPRARRRKSKDLARERAQEKARATEALLDQTGIRTLRRKPVFTTPNYFPPQAPGLHDPRNNASDPVAHNESPELLHCYVCKQKYTRIHHFYDQLCSTCDTRPASRHSARNCWRRVPGWTSSSTTPARPCAAHRRSMPT